MNESRAGRFSDKSAGMAKETAKGLQEGYLAAAEGIRDFNTKLIEMAQANVTAALDLARQISTAKGPAEAIELWSSHAQKQFETLTEQSKELTTLAQKVATSSAGSMTRFGEAVRWSS
jgi:hypothetical protein